MPTASPAAVPGRGPLLCPGVREDVGSAARAVRGRSAPCRPPAPVHGRRARPGPAALPRGTRGCRVGGTCRTREVRAMPTPRRRADLPFAGYLEAFEGEPVPSGVYDTLSVDGREFDGVDAGGARF